MWFTGRNVQRMLTFPFLGQRFTLCNMRPQVICNRVVHWHAKGPSRLSFTISHSVAKNATFSQALFHVHAHPKARNLYQFMNDLWTTSCYPLLHSHWIKSTESTTISKSDKELRLMVNRIWRIFALTGNRCQHARGMVVWFTKMSTPAEKGIRINRRIWCNRSLQAWEISPRFASPTCRVTRM